jgi:hypothetical protein
MKDGEKLLLIAAAGLGGYLLFKSTAAGQAASSTPGSSGTITDPGGGAPASPLSPPQIFPVYGPGGSSVSTAAAVGAQSAPPAGQAATLKAISGAGTIATRNTSGATSSPLLSPSQAQLAAIAARAPIGGPNISTRQFYVAPTPVASPQAVAEILATTADYSTAAHIRPGITGAAAMAAGAAPLSKTAAAQIVATSADYSTAAHTRPPTPTDILAAQAAQAQANAFKAAIAQPHPSIASRTTYRPPAPPPPRPPAPAPVVNAQGQRRTGGGQLV